MSVAACQPRGGKLLVETTQIHTEGVVTTHTHNTQVHDAGARCVTPRGARLVPAARGRRVGPIFVLMAPIRSV